MKFPVMNSPTAAGLPIILINWIFGLGIIQYPMGRQRPVISTLWSIAHFLAYLNFVRMANFPEIVELQGSKIAANNYRMSTYCCVVFVAISICLAYFRTKLVQVTFTKLIDMNIRLKILGIPNDYKSFFKSQIVQICVAFAWIFAIVVLDFKYSGFDFPTEMSRLGFFMAFHYFLMFAFVVDCSFGAHIRYFGNRFHRLNALLTDSDSTERNGTTFAQSDNKFRSYSSVILEIHGNNSPLIKAAKKQWLLYVIRETRKIHRGFCKSAEELNRAFSSQLLFSVALTLFLIITLLYTSYILGTLNNSINNNWLDYIIVVMWITFYAMRIFLIVDACETTSCEANRTRGLISKLLDTAAGDADIRDELIQNPLTFTANGFFTLNYSLIQGMIGSVTTFLVIMIQMRGIYEPEDTISTPDSTTLVWLNSTD